MFQTTIYFDLDRACVLSDITAEADHMFSVTQEEVHEDDLITFLIDTREHGSMATRLEASPQVESVERIDDRRLLVTKRSCGALPIIRRNHGKLEGIDRVNGTQRIFDVIIFRRADLKRIVEGLNEIGTARLGSLSRYGTGNTCLSDRQAEVIERALDHGYFDWPRGIDATALADDLDIAHSTALEHLRKAEKKLLLEALERGTEPAATPDDRAFMLDGTRSAG